MKRTPASTPWRPALLAALATTLLLLNGCGGTDRAPQPDGPAVRAVSVGFEDVVREDQDWDAVNAQLADAGANAVNIAVGRPDWTAFPWPGQEATESAQVAESGRDFVRDAVDALRTAPDGSTRRITLTVDMLVPGWIESDEDVAGRDVEGEASPEFPSAAALHDGEVGQRLQEMVAHISDTYEPDEIALTELMFDDHTFGDDDLELYREMTGEEDWPRTEDGDIDASAPGIAEWRSRVLADVVSDTADTSRAAGVELAVDVRAPWSDPSADRAESGHDYELLASAADHIVIWNYFGLNERTASYSREITDALQSSGIPSEKVIMSVGLWADSQGRSDAAGEGGTDEESGEVLTPDEVREGLEASATNGVRSVSVTPMSLMDEDHWGAVAAAWENTGT